MSRTPNPSTHHWPAEDKLDRKMDADILLRFIEGKLDQRALAGLPRSYVLNLDSQWGSGKTFFLKNLKELIAARGQIAVYVDAWQDDHSDDPFIAVVSGIEEELKRVIQGNDALSGLKKAVLPVARSTLKVVGSGLKSGFLHYAKKQVGREALEELGGLINSDEGVNDIEANRESILKATDSALDAAGTALLSGFTAAKQARESFRENLTNLTKELAQQDNVSVPVFVLIDELDRCRPSYAIELLEEVKHLFYVENMVFILATDTEQLAHAVSGAYGSGFDGRRYLSRFIDRTYRFRKTGIDDFVKHCLHLNGISEGVFNMPDGFGVSGFLTAAFERSDASLRYIEQIVDYLATFVATWEYKGLKINLVLLFDLSVKAHPESSRDEDGAYRVLKTVYEFSKFTRGASNTTSKYTIVQMVRGIEKMSTDFRSGNDPKDNFVLWARNMVGDEIRAMRTLNSNRESGEFRGIADEYPRMFHDMLGVHEALVDD